MPVTFRNGRASDVAALLEFWSVAAENDTRPADKAEAIERLIDRDAAALMLAVDGGQIVGSVIAGWDGWRCHLYRLAVHPDRRREGIGGQLIARAERRLADAGASRIDAMVLDGNELGQSVWARSGYRRQPEWSRWVKPL